MKVERLEVKACCGKTTVAFKIDSPLSKNILPLLVKNGFIESKHFTVAGLLYAESKELIVNGPFGSNIIHVKCKINGCSDFINQFENLITAE